jgi:serine/threonine protein kinase
LAQQQFPIAAQGLTIGRHPHNDIVLSHEAMVSRYHAAIALENGQYVLYDRDSANGTWVNEQRVFRHVLAPGDRVEIWHSHFVFGLHDTPPPRPEPEPRPSPTPRPTIHAVGEQFCGYYLESLIGRGGMSEVFLGRDAQGTPVAIKILYQTDPYLVDKFVQEGNQIGPLLRGHANIVHVHEFGQSPEGRLYLVMEYVEAQTLRKAVKAPVGEDEAVKIMGQVCSALAYAHENGVVHRDIKPENILLTEDGVAKVLDFGIAKLTSASTVTRDKIVGTPEYLSPEQARGDPVEPGSDVYALGIVLYELLCGSVPFRQPRGGEPYRAAIEVVRQHLEEDPEPLRRRNPELGISRRIERVTMRALKKQLKDRYPSAKEMGKAMGQPGPPPSRATKIEPRASLIIVQGRRQGERIPLAGEPVVLGRLVLDASDTTISRSHASISFRGGSFWLTDTSKNGTWVNDMRVYGEIPLTSGTLVRIGDNVLRLE